MSFRLFLYSLLAAVLLSACSTYSERVAPIELPDPERGGVEVAGVKLAGVAFLDPEEARGYFGFDVRRAGMLPVQLTFVNDSGMDVRVNTSQTLLVDEENRAWPVLSAERAYERAKSFVELGETVRESGKPALLMGAAGAVIGAAIALVAGDNIGVAAGKGAVIGGGSGLIIGGSKGYAEAGERVRRDLAEKSLGNSPIKPGQLAYGVLFFPGKQGDEAESARELRLMIQVGPEQHSLLLPLQTSGKK